MNVSEKLRKTHEMPQLFRKKLSSIVGKFATTESEAPLQNGQTRVCACVCVINATVLRITYPRPKVFSWWAIGKGFKLPYYHRKRNDKKGEKKENKKMSAVSIPMIIKIKK